MLCLFLNVETSNLVVGEIIITLTDQNGRLLETEDKVDLTLFVNKYKCDDILQNQELLDTGLDAVKTTSKRVVHEAGKFIGEKLQMQ